MMRYRKIRRSFSVAAAFMLFCVVLSSLGCSKGKTKTEPDKEKPVVTDMNIKTTSIEESSEGKTTDPSEIETLPYEEDSGSKEEEQPLLTPQK